MRQHPPIPKRKENIPNQIMAGESHGHEEEDDGLDVGPGKAHKHIEKEEHEEVFWFSEKNYIKRQKG